jgi:hypothetical protein
MAAKPERLREASALLKRRGVKRPSPAKLAAASQELGLGLAETLAFIMRLKQGPQNQQAQRREILARVKE